MVGSAVQVLAPPQAGEQQGPVDVVFPVVASVAIQHCRQILGRGIGVPQVELDQLALLQHLADGQRPAAVVHAHHVADEKVPLSWFVNELVHHNAQEEGVAHQSLVPLRKGGEQGPEDVQRCFAVQRFQHVAPALGDAHGLADWAAPLRHHRVDGDVAVQGDPHCAGAVYAVAQKQGIASLLLPPAGQTADFGGAGEGKVHAQDQVLHGEGKWIGQQHELGGVGWTHL